LHQGLFHQLQRRVDNWPNYPLIGDIFQVHVLTTGCSCLSDWKVSSMSAYVEYVKNYENSQSAIKKLTSSPSGAALIQVLLAKISLIDTETEGRFSSSIWLFASYSSRKSSVLCQPAKGNPDFALVWHLLRMCSKARLNTTLTGQQLQMHWHCSKNWKAL
jgi:hypothetical protein